MKTLMYVFGVLALLFCGCFAFASSADDINQIQGQLNADFTKQAALVTVSSTQDKKADDIKFVYDAYTKTKAKYDQDLTAYNTKAAEVMRGYQLLQPSVENYSQRVQSHNAHQCTETCRNGSCDGSCAWYTNERIQLDANKAQLQQAAAPLDAQASQLQTDKGYLDQTFEKLNLIQQGVKSDVAAWKAAQEKLKADWLANEAEIAALQATLAKVKGENDACLAKIPPACQISPLLDDQCEKMHAACGRMFDGNR